MTTVDQRPWAADVDEGAVQPLVAHLVDNAAGYDVASAQASRWRGPYMDGLSAYPWGFRYGVNVGLFGGHDGLVETPFAMVDLRQGGDDVVSVIGSGQ